MIRRIVLGIAVLVLLALAGLAALIAITPRLSPATVQASAPELMAALQTNVDPNTGILVSGQGTATAKPNIALATIGVEITAPNLTDATSQNTTKMNAVLDKL